MSLILLKNYLQQNRMCTLADMAQNCGLSVDLARDMLKVWETKGCVRKCLKTPACGKTCSQCKTADIEIYQWIKD